MGLFVCNHLILPARPHKLNKRGNWVLIKSQEWSCVKDTTTPDRHRGKVCLVNIPCEQPPGPGSTSLEPFDVWLEEKSFPLINLLLEGKWEDSRWPWALDSPDLPTELVFEPKRHDWPHTPFCICPNRGLTSSPIGRKSEESFSGNLCVSWGKY